MRKPVGAPPVRGIFPRSGLRVIQTRLFRNGCPFAASMVCHRNINVNARPYAGRQAVSVDPGRRTDGRDRMAHGGAMERCRSALNLRRAGPFLGGREVSPAALIGRGCLAGAPGGSEGTGPNGRPIRDPVSSRNRCRPRSRVPATVPMSARVAQVGAVASRADVWGILSPCNRFKRAYR
jgi:hypothetical protein